MQVIISTAKKTEVYKGCHAVTLRGSNGHFQILPDHKNFIALLLKGSIYVTRSDKSVKDHIITAGSVLCFDHERSTCRVMTGG
jgi:F0F1-type ATP synthase epsilon subunit